jgi:hypothetical protein
MSNCECSIKKSPCWYCEARTCNFCDALKLGDFYNGQWACYACADLNGLMKNESPAPSPADEVETLSYEDLQGRCWYLEHQLAECLPWLYSIRDFTENTEELETLIIKLEGV